MLFRFALALLLCISWSCSQKPTAPELTKASLIITGGKVYTVNPDQPTAEALAVAEGRILKVGSTQEVMKHKGEQTEVITLAGELVLPGFIEGHGHFINFGHALMNLRLADTKNWQEVAQRVEAATKTVPEGTWILGRGWHQEKWDTAPEKTVAGFPTHDAVSAISPNHPVLLSHASGHAVFANAKAMELAGIDQNTQDPAGGEILRDAQGHAIGVFSETAEGLVRKPYKIWQDQLSSTDLLAAKKRAVKLASETSLANGITSFQDAGSSYEEIDFLKEMADNSQLNLRLWIMLGVSNQELEARGKHYADSAYQNDFLKVGGIKRYIDGALGSRGAWLIEPYSDAPETKGHNVMSLEELRKTATLAKELGLQLCTHAIGDRGNREVLDLYGDFVKDQNLRWRIEHAQHLNPLDIPKFAELGVIASMQGIHCTSDAPFVVKRLGEERADQGAYVWRKLLESGAMVNNGTDVPVEAIDPLANLHALVTRQPKSGAAFYPAQALSIDEAIKAYTLSNAYATFQEVQKGSLEVGKLADITILSKDITIDPAQTLPTTTVLYTIVNGDVKYKQ